ncbi:CST complex subunit CTC1 isoform X2 [Durio zibethinus]|uniref:CST complex subunit CTC1 n=1 Tax=Durio zibethinus TaxID=66656 RepID=A0A6P6AV95_DURZI|nr:CST complex subunit CTC1 isoform X2 [Durio zibethinus]
MDDVKILTVSDLLRYGRPHTGSSSFSPAIVSHQNPNPSPDPGLSSSNPSPNRKALTPLDCPAVIVGTLRLPTLTLKCPQENCLEFSDDDSSAICCDIIGLDDLSIIGKKIHVLTWNFIPSKHLSGGFLEIVKWKLPDSFKLPEFHSSHGLNQCSSLIIDEFKLVSSSIESKPSNAKTYQIHGALESVSPVSVVPCSVNNSSSSNSMNLRGFLVRVMTCECKLCRSKESIKVLYAEACCHSFTEPVFVYFCESAWCWHPVMTKLTGNIITISGLKKKLVFMGKQGSDLMFVTAENSVLHLPKLLKKWVPLSCNAVKGNGKCGSYTGIVNNVYMQGMVVELDKEVWLLLTDQLLMPPHSLRVGAVISVINVHFVNPKFSWAKFLVLGACFRTSIKVESFSPYKTGCPILSQKQSQLGKFIESLAFSTRLWVLLIVSCFQKKFSGILSGEKILGSTHKEGLVQAFASSHVPSSVFRARCGVLMEFSKHESCDCATEPYHGNLKLVVPISSFIHHCEAIWIKAVLPLDNVQPRSCGGKSYLPSQRKTFKSEDLGIVLVGMLKICPSSGRLQLVDMTGSIDAIIPDLPSNWNPNSIFEVIDYSLTVEGMPESVNSEFHSNDLFSCRSIFQCFPSARKRNLKIFVYFHLCNATCRNLLIYAAVDCQNELNEIENGTFHLIHITRKFPLLQKFKGHSILSKRSGVFAEAIVLPWYLLLAGKDGSVRPYKDSRDYADGNYIDHALSKRRKTDGASTCVTPGLGDNFGSASFGKNTSLRETSVDQSCLRMSFSHEIPCLATIRGVNNIIFTRSGRLCTTKANAKIKIYEESAEKNLLEFTSESDLKYQIGGFYLMKHHLKDPLCNIKKDDKVLITSGTYFRSLSLSPEFLTTDKSLHDSSLCDDEVFTKDQVLRVASDSSVSDVHLHVSSSLTGFREINTKELGKGLNVPGANLGENSSLSPGIETIIVANLEENSGSLGYNCLFPEGNLTSLCGDVIAVHRFDQGSSDMRSSSEDFADLPHFGFSNRTYRFCIHVSVGHQTVRIFGSLCQNLFPTGFGPGINATFHQILQFRGPSTLMLTPVSIIVINSIRVVNEVYGKKCSHLWSSDMHNESFTKMAASSVLISELMRCLDGNLNRFRCRVVSVHVLVLEKRNSICDDLKSNMYSRPLSVDIPLACFILDDGSSSWCCWANAERAATLLRLHEYPLSTFEASGYGGRWVRIQNTEWTSTMYHLERILEKHHRITVKSTRSISDSFDQDFTVSVSSGKALSGLDEDLYLLISLIFNACINTSWTVVAGVMDSNAVNLLKEHFLELEMSMPPMKNLWATEVYHVNQLTEARDMIQKLINK